MMAALRLSMIVEKSEALLVRVVVLLTGEGKGGVFCGRGDF